MVCVFVCVCRSCLFTVRFLKQTLNCSAGSFWDCCAVYAVSVCVVPCAGIKFPLGCRLPPDILYHTNDWIYVNGMLPKKWYCSTFLTYIRGWFEEPYLHMEKPQLNFWSLSSVLGNSQWMTSTTYFRGDPGITATRWMKQYRVIPSAGINK